MTTKLAIQDLFKDLLKYLPSVIIPVCIGFLSIPIITRLFSPEIYANYTLLMTTVMIFITCGGWVGMALIRFYAEAQRDSDLETFNQHIIDMLTITLFVLTLLFALVSGIFCWRDQSLVLLFLLGYFLLALGVIVDTLKLYLSARRHSGRYSLIHAFGTTVPFLCALFLIYVLNTGIESFLLGSIVTLVVTLPLLWRWTVRSVYIPHISRSQTSSEWFAYSLPLVIGNLGAIALSASDRYLIDFFCTKRDLGIYSASYVISDNCILILVTIFQMAIVPIGLRLWSEKNTDAIRSFLSQTTRVYLLVGIPMVAGASILAKPAISLLTEAAYHEAYIIVPWVAFGSFIFGLNQRMTLPLQFVNKTKVMMYGFILAALLKICLNIGLIPIYGYMAAAMTTPIGYFCLLTYNTYYSRRAFAWPFPMRPLINIVCATVIMCVILILLSHLISGNIIQLISFPIIGVAIYMISILALREVTLSEIQTALPFLKR